MKKNKFILPVVVVALIAIAGFQTVRAQDSKKKYDQVIANPSDYIKDATKKETEALVATVSKTVNLPKDETPSLATVEDTEKLKDQPFFKDAKKGDKVLIYAAARQAFIYRTEEGKLINSGPIAITQTQGKIPVTVIGKEADRNAVEALINQKYPDKATIVKADAKAPHVGVLVVDLTGPWWYCRNFAVERNEA
jgi:hypothetical protein